MKTWYIMIHFEGPYVDGFISFGETPKQAIKSLKKALWVRLVEARKKEKGIQGYTPDEFSTRRLKSYLRSLKRPWRTTERNDPVVRITELSLPLKTGYWLADVIRATHYCNLTDTNNPAEVYGKKAEEELP